MKYKIGDKVKIRSDLIIGKIYGDEPFGDSMARFLGMDAVIEEIVGGDYILDIDDLDCFWNDEMLLCKTEEDIVKELIERGLSSEEIQDAYNRYMSHLNKVEELEHENVELKKDLEFTKNILAIESKKLNKLTDAIISKFLKEI